MTSLVGIADFTCTLLALALAIAAHEAGHLLGGALGGLRLALFVVGPFAVRRERRQGAADRLRAGINSNATLYGGAVGMFPGTGVAQLRHSFAGFVFGGPLSSVVLGVCALALFARSGLPIGAPHSPPVPSNVLLIAGHALFAFGVASFGLGVMTLLPWRIQGLLSDGLRGFQLTRNRAHGDREASLLGLGGYLLGGWRPRDWNPELLAESLKISDGSYSDLMGHYLAYLNALDCEQVAAAAGHVDYMLAHATRMPSSFRPALQHEGAYFEAAYRRAPEAARQRLESAGSSALVDKATRLRCEVAILLASGELARAAAILQQARAVAATDPGAAFTFAELERLERLAASPEPAVRPASRGGRRPRIGPPEDLPIQRLQ